MKSPARIALILLLTGGASPARADHGSYRMLSNRSFEAVGTGLASAAVCEVSDPTNRAEVERAIAMRLQRTQLDPARRSWQKTEQFLRRHGRLKPRQRLRFDRLFVVRHNNRLLIPWPTQSADLRRQAPPTLTFQFVNFSAAEEQQLRDFLNGAMPVMTAVFGAPFQSGTVTIRSDPNLQSLEAGIYIVSTNEIRIPPLSNNFEADAFNLIHMVLHAFHGAAVFTFDAWEEGFTHAAAQVVQRFLNPNFDPRDDPFFLMGQYDALNLPALGNPTFFPESGFGGMTPWRLGMSEAAWLKVYAENPSFFSQFHAQYYAQFNPAATVPLAGNVPALKVIAQAIAPMVEGQSFMAWYRSEYALDTAAAFGNKLYVFTLPLDQSIPMLIYNYTTSSTGDENGLTARANLTYSNDESLDLFAEEGNVADIAAGEGAISPQFFNLGAPNRVDIDLVVNELRLRIPYPWKCAGNIENPNKLFGAVLNSESGSVRITPQGSAPITAAVERGVYTVTSGFTNTGVVPLAIEYQPTDGTSSLTVKRNIFIGSIGFLETIIVGRPQVATVTNTFTFGTNGLHLMCLPLSPTTTDEADALGIPRNRLLLARWRPDLPGENKYEIYPNVTQPFQPGLGYWLKVLGDTTVNVAGVPPPIDAPTRVRLIQGFNLIGNPYSAAINLTNLRVEPANGVAVDLSTAINQGLIAPGVFRFDPGAGYVIETAQLQPFRGYWLRATSLGGLTLLFTPPAGLSSRRLKPGAATSTVTRATATRSASAALDPLRPPANGMSLQNWMLRLQATAPGARDSDNCVGATAEASDHFDAKYDIVKPPPLQDFVTLNLVAGPGAPRGAKLAGDLRAPFQGPKQFEFIVETDRSDTEITLTWPNVHQTPKDLRFHLTDLDTQVTRSLRTSANYTFRLGGLSRVRRFRLNADTTPCPLLEVAQLTAQTQGLNTVVSFSLSRPARVTLDIVGPAGKTVRRMLNGLQLNAGLNVVTWDGREQSGRVMARGLYMIALQASDDDGNVCNGTKQVQLR